MTKRWTVEKDLDTTPSGRLVFGYRPGAVTGTPWCDELIIRLPDWDDGTGRGHNLRMVPAAFDALAALIEPSSAEAEHGTGLTANELVYAIESFLDPQRCDGTGSLPGTYHCAACCNMSGWSGVTTQTELDAAKALDVALVKLKAAVAEAVASCR